MRASSSLRAPQPDERFGRLKREVTPLVILLTLTGLLETVGGIAILLGSAMDPTLYLVVGANVLVVLFYFAWKRHLHSRREDRGTIDFGGEQHRG